MRGITFYVLPLLLLFACVAEAQTLRVTAERTTLRDKPSTDGAIVTSVVKGDELTVVSKAGTWYQVRAKATGAEGYVNSLLVEVIDAVAAPSSPAPPATAPTPAAAPPTPPAPPTRTQPATPTPTQQTSGSDRNYFIRVFGGLATGYGDAGFGGGGGVGLRPFGNDRAEIAIDALYGRSGEDFSFGTVANVDVSTSVLVFSGNFLYNFPLSGQSFTPFAGGGLAMSRTSTSFSSSAVGVPRTALSYDGTFTAIQLLGGIEKALNDHRALRFELRTGFYSFSSSVLVLAGLSF